MKLLGPRGIRGSYPILLDSARLHPKTGKTSFFASAPVFTYRSKKSRIELVQRGRGDCVALESTRLFQGNPLQILRQIWKDPSALALPEDWTAAMGYFGYDLKDSLESLPDLAKDDLGLPDILLHFYDGMVPWDPVEEETRSLRPTPSEIHLRPLLSHEAFCAMVACAQESIARGDIYQANLSQRFDADFHGDPLEFYAALRAINPSPFMAYVDCGDFQLVSASPERLVRVRGREVETRPIAGTRPRGTDALDDERLRQELLLSSKERAEHIMLVDLERNDLGRVCESGSVQVDEMMVLEPYSHVTHIVSNVTGRLRPQVDWVDVLAAVFPGGTITGCPKVRCMEIIESLEPVKRGPYSGSIGYILRNGDMDLNIAIRTAIVKNQRAYIQVGAGIVADSNPEQEYQETLHKGQALFEALRRVG